MTSCARIGSPRAWNPGEGPAGALLRRLTPERRRALRAAARLGRKLGAPVYLIGGSVRDLLLGLPSPDLDLCVVGDGPAFARALARDLGAALTEQPRFGTAALSAPWGRVDVATARREVYARPGALPTVAQISSPREGDIRDDLARRDFTANAMALRLDAPRRRLLDPFGGREDLERRQLRALHDRSFVEDPTRLLRAARYAARLGLRLERATARQARQAIAGGCLDTVSGDRIRRELMMLLAEERADVGIRLCEKLGLLGALQPGLEGGVRTRAALRRAQRLCDRFSRRMGGASLDCALVRLLALAEPLREHGARLLAERLRLTAPQRRALQAYVERRAPVRRALGRPRARASVLARALDPLPTETVAAIAATSSARVRRRCVLYLEHLRDMKSRLRGEDLAEAGWEPGPQWGAALAAARAARLDGRARTRERELRVAEAVLRSRGAGRRT